MTRSRKAALAAAAALTLVLAGCAQQYDYEGANYVDPDEATIYGNVDQHPNVVRLCIDGVAFATTTREYGDAVTRVPEWDEHCEQVRRG